MTLEYVASVSFPMHAAFILKVKEAWARSAWDFPEPKMFSDILEGMCLDLLIHAIIFCKVFSFFFYCCAMTVVLIIPPLLSSALPAPTSHIQSYHPHCLCPWVLYMFLDFTLPLLSPLIILPPLLWSLSVCSLFPCLWFYLAHLFVLLISLQL